MGLPNGVHHLAICTKNMKEQVEFFTQVVGMELVALYWMHGVKNTYHGFVKLGDSSSIAFVQGPESERFSLRPVYLIRAGRQVWLLLAQCSICAECRHGRDLLTMRDRVRSHGHWVMGPLEHGFCKSIYFAGPEGMMLEFSTSEGEAIDAESWIDPEVVKLNGMSPEELEKYKNPPAFESQAVRSKTLKWI